MARVLISIVTACERRCGSLNHSTITVVLFLLFGIFALQALPAEPDLSYCMKEHLARMEKIVKMRDRQRMEAAARQSADTLFACLKAAGVRSPQSRDGH